MRICLIGDYNPDVTAHQAIPEALALTSNGQAIKPEWLDTESALQASLEAYDGFWCVPASPYRSMEGALRAIRYARESKVPFLGTCGGCQHAVLEYARNVLRIPDAGHKESDPNTPQPVITRLSCALIEASEKLELVAGTRLRHVYGTDEICETYRCSFGLNAAYVLRLEQAGMRVSAKGPQGEPRAVELSGHPFFVGTLFQPERSALRGERHPLIEAFSAAVRASQSDRRR